MTEINFMNEKRRMVVTYIEHDWATSSKGQCFEGDAYLYAGGFLSRAAVAS